MTKGREENVFIENFGKKIDDLIFFVRTNLLRCLALNGPDHAKLESLGAEIAENVARYGLHFFPDSRPGFGPTRIPVHISKEGLFISEINFPGWEWSMLGLKKAAKALTKNLNKNQALTTSTNLKIKEWSDLAIGIDENRKYFVISPPPHLGDEIKKKDSLEFPLPKGRWPKLLEALATSSSGKSVSQHELMKLWKYLPPPSSLEKDSRARPGSISQAQTQDLKGAIKKPREKILTNLREFAGDLRRCLATSLPCDIPYDSARDPIVFFFVVAFLIPDSSGKLHFGDKTTA